MFFEHDFSERVFLQPPADALIELLKSPYVFGTWPINRLYGEVFVTLVAAAKCPIRRQYDHN
jgi:hypothetical protein